MTLWKKPNGTELEVNDRPETIEYAESLGWKRVEVPVKKPVKRMVAKPKKTK